jgi:uncharacterized membrane protein YdjX (TVP38/TMEM64 family)
MWVVFINGDKLADFDVNSYQNIRGDAPTINWLTGDQRLRKIVETTVQHYKLIILVILLVLGLVLQQAGAIDLEELIILARQYADRWWLGVLLVVIQTILFTFAMAGSSIVWITAAIFTPATSTAIIASGTTLGGISAYFFSKRLSGEWSQKIKFSRIYQSLRKESNFFTLFALRVMPGFPHSVINYSCGILKTRLISFILAAFSGTAIKTYVYSIVIYNITTPDTLTRTINLSSVWPLMALSILILAVTAIKHYLKK